MSRTATEIRGIDDRQQPAPEATLDLAIEDRERGSACGLVGLAASNQGAQCVRRDNFGRREMAGSEGRLAGSCRPDQKDERRIG
jgi:hypothetical protein